MTEKEDTMDIRVAAEHALEEMLYRFGINNTPPVYRGMFIYGFIAGSEFSRNSRNQSDGVWDAEQQKERRQLD